MTGTLSAETIEYLHKAIAIDKAEAQSAKHPTAQIHCANIVLSIEHLIPKAPRPATQVEFLPRKERKVTTTPAPQKPSNERIFCSQCERNVLPTEAQLCKSQWCKAK